MKRVFERHIWLLLTLALLAALCPITRTEAFAPAPNTAYAAEFIAKCEGQQWFIDEVERLLNLEQKTLDTMVSAEDFANVSALGFKDRGISGTIPSAIGELKNLRYLFLSGNNFSGAIPAELFTLDRLQEIDLADNNYTGAIPPQFGSIPSLISLNLKNNGFTGTIPETVLNNDSITILNLEGNSLSGAIPSGINNMAGLLYLNLSENALGGTIPDISGLTALTALSLWNCNLTGEIHDSVYTLDKLQILDLAHNGLTGEISPDLENLALLEFLSLSANRLTGVIPTGIQALTRLQTLNLSNNRLRGTIPDVFDAVGLEEIRLDNNYLRGVVPVTLKARYDAGVAVFLRNNYLTGADLRDMSNNSGNFTDGAAGEQYQLTAAQAVQISKADDTNVYALLRNRSLTTGNTTQKILLNPDEYSIIFDETKLDITITALGIFVKALEDIPSADNLTIEIRILDNTGSDYSRVLIKVTTETVTAGSGSGPGIGPGGSAASDPQDDPVSHAYRHIPYISGYPDGNFKPDGNISREEIAAMVIRALEITPGRFAVSSFADVTASRWSFSYVEEATDRGYFRGYPDGSFNPENNMTRAELATLLVRIARQQGKIEDASSISFSDLNTGAWYYEDTLASVRFGLIGGYPDGTFKPNDPVTRAEAVTMINRLIGRNPETAPDLRAEISPFADVNSSHWAYMQIKEASLEHSH